MKKSKQPNPARRVRVLIVDDHPIVRAGLANLLASQADMAVCGSMSTAREALNTLDKLRPDLALVDISLPGESGLELIKEFKARSPRTLILVLSIHDEALYAERALRAGAHGYVMKEEEPARILAAIRHVLAGQLYVSAQIAGHMMKGGPVKHHDSRSGVGQLSDREIEILTMLGQGKGTGLVAKSLHLSPKTVDAHRGNIKTKLRLRTANELVCYAARWVESQKTTETFG